MLGCVLIPFHHREDLLIPLLRHLTEFPVVVVDDGPTKSDWSVWHRLHPNLECVRAGGSSGFTSAVNRGLHTVQSLGYRTVLILNDDAWISTAGIAELFSKAGPQILLSPVLEHENTRYFGVRVHSWGRVTLNFNAFQKIDALLGACLVMPTHLRFDSRFHHGFEDIHLTHQALNRGFELQIVESVLCRHIGGGTLDSHSPTGLRYSFYGHLCFYNSLRRLPVIWSLGLAQILKHRNLHSISHVVALHQGLADWLWSAMAARIASSRAGSSKIK